MVTTFGRAAAHSREFRRDPIITSISRLDDSEIQSMRRDDLLEVIRLSRGLKALPAIPSGLRDCPRAQLVEFALLARDNCRDQPAPPRPLPDRSSWFSAG